MKVSELYKRIHFGHAIWSDQIHAGIQDLEKRIEQFIRKETKRKKKETLKKIKKNDKPRKARIFVDDKLNFAQKAK